LETIAIMATPHPSPAQNIAIPRLTYSGLAAEQGKIAFTLKDRRN
jgi:hypothetical protein